MYAVEYGVRQDLIKAHMWLNIAASQDEEDAGDLRDKLASEMSPSQIEKAN
jgi:TPR repeat protein